MDFGKVAKLNKPVKEAFLMMKAVDGSWQDVHVVLHSTYLSVQKLIGDARLLVRRQVLCLTAAIMGIDGPDCTG